MLNKKERLGRSAVSGEARKKSSINGEMEEGRSDNINIKI